MALWRLYYHLIWATKNRQPLINPKREAELYRYIIAKADTHGCIVHAIGGMEEHIHLERRFSNHKILVQAGELGELRELRELRES